MPDAIISINQTVLGESIANVVCFSNITEIEADLQSFADSIRDTFETHVEDQFSDQWTLDDITVSFIDADSVTYSVTVPFTQGALAGLEQSQVLSTTTCLLVSTQFIGPAPNRGRIYFGGLTENSNVDSAWGAGTLFAFRDLVENWRDGIPIGAGLAFLRILRRPSTVHPIYISSPVTNVVTRLRPANQRRRRIGN